MTLAALAIATFIGALALSGCAAGDASNDTRTTNASQCNAGSIPDAETGASDIQLLVAAGSSIPTTSWSSYRDMAVEVADCAGPGTRLDIHPITGSSFSTPALFSGSVPESDRSTKVNPLLLRERKNQYVTAVTKAIARLPSVELSGRSDPIGAIKVAADELAVRPADHKRVIIAIFSGWQQAPPANMYVYHTDPRKLVNVSIARLKAAEEMPHLQGIDVSIFGISSGAMRVSDTNLEEMCGYWTAIVRAAGGNLRNCAASVASSN